jgi:hypothetical protein
LSISLELTSLPLSTCPFGSTVSGEWYKETPTTFEGSTCDDGHEVKQLKQWSRCLSLIKEYENKTKSKFDAVVKIRPDDLW